MVLSRAEQGTCQGGLEFEEATHWRRVPPVIDLGGATVLGESLKSPA